MNRIRTVVFGAGWWAISAHLQVIQWHLHAELLATQNLRVTGQK